jgi:hypothetical protein
MTVALGAVIMVIGIGVLRLVTGRRSFGRRNDSPARFPSLQTRARQLR